MPDDNLLFQPPTPTRSDALKNRALLLETAAHLFEEQGVEAVSMSMIAETAGVGKGTLYRHFENKMVLCEALLDHSQRELQARTLAKMRTERDPRTVLRWFMTEVIHFVNANREFLCVQGAPETLSHPAHWWWRQTIRGLIIQINGRDDVDFLSDSIYLLLDVRSINYARTVRGYSLERIESGMQLVVDRLIPPLRAR
jgi:AcrR family transcriptional regulator